MDFIELLLILIGLICPWFCWRSVKTLISEIRRIRRCTVETTAEILSWRVEEDSDNPTKCTPTIRYSFDGQVYEVEFWNGTVTLYQKERDYTGDTMTIWIDPNDPTNAAPEQKGRFLFRSIEGAVVVCGIALFFFLIAVVSIYVRFI